MSLPPWRAQVRRFRGNSRHPASVSNTTRLTHNVTSAPSITALRKVYSITSSASESRLSEIFTPMALAVFELMTRTWLAAAHPLTGRETLPAGATVCWRVW